MYSPLECHTFTTLKIPCASLINPTLSFPKILPTTDLFTVIFILSECHVVVSKLYERTSQTVFFFKLAIMLLTFFHIFLWLDSSSFFIDE